MKLLLMLLVSFFSACTAWAGEADLIMPDLSSVKFFNTDGHTLLLWGMIICGFGFLFGLVQFIGIMRLKAHRSMREISELIKAQRGYELNSKVITAADQMLGATVQVR